MPNRILVVPDIHGRIFWKEPVSRYMESVDRIVFLGDYLDPYKDDDGLAVNIFENLLDIIELKRANPEKVVLLKGNHDEHYSSEWFRELAAGSRMSYENWDSYHETFNQYKDLFQLAHLEMVNDIPYVFTHAGLTVYWMNKVNSQLWCLVDREISVADPHIIEKINQLDTTIEGQVLLSIVGRYRSRFGEKTGSILWADIEEHPLPNAQNVYGLNQVFQVFGHTRLDGYTDDMIRGENLAMIDSQKCFMIDETIKEKIVTIRDYERNNTN